MCVCALFMFDEIDEWKKNPFVYRPEMENALAVGRF